MERLDLQTLLGPISTDVFFRDHWPDELLVVHGDPDRIAPLSSLPPLQSARALAAVHHESVLAYLAPDDAERERREGCRVRADEAVDLYDRGARLEFNYIDRWIPEVSDHMRRICRDLGMPPDRVTCSFFAMPPGQVVTPHIDTQPALCLQLRGTKTWRIGPRPSMPAPLHNHVLGQVSPVIGQYYDGEIETRMPDDSLEVVMEPGSLVYLPRGLPHETVSHDHTLSLTLDINHSTWADLVLEGLRRRLDREQGWREHAVGVDGTAPQRAAALRRLQGLLPGLRGALEDVMESPEEIIALGSPPIVPGPRRSYRRRPQVGMILEGSGPLVVHHPGQGRTEVEISEDLVPLCRWIAAQPGPFLDRDAYVESRTASRGDVVTILSVLQEIDALEAIPA